MIVKQILVSLLSMLMLVASTGATVHQMVCLHCGNAEYSFDAIECCTKDYEKETLKRTCCEFFSVQFKTDNLLNSVEKHDVQQAKSFATQFVVWSSLGSIKNQIIKTNFDIPPPLKQPVYQLTQRILC